MLTLIGGIIGIIAAGCAIYGIILTLNWLKNKIKEKLALRNAKKAVAADLKELIRSCGNTISFMTGLEKQVKDGCTNLIAVVDNNDNVADVEVIRDTSAVKDEVVKQLINCTGDGMVVITK